MTTYTFQATSNTASGTTTLQNTGEFDTVEQAREFMNQWVQALNAAGYNGTGNWLAEIVAP